MTAWVRSPPQVDGLDHLAVQAPCINIYGRLLPGITNVTERAGVKYTRQRGEQLARAMDRTVDRSLFMASIEEDMVTPERLEQLHTFCPCRLKQSTREQQLLQELFFVRKDFYHEDALARRRTLQLLMYLADALAEEENAFDLYFFRACVYTGALPGGALWNLPEGLQQNRNNWAIYQRNELLSIAMQGIFFVVLDAYERSGLTCSSSHPLLCFISGSTPK
ncbi:MAG: hypothetical protein GY801_33510 [bacterium]|nr:hypothetical protein [bacterium]